MKTVQFESIHDNYVYTILIGQNAKDNWNIIDKSSNHDIWFHVENQSSCHIILKLENDKQKPHKSVLKYCAVLCKSGSKNKSDKNISICYTTIANITKGKINGSIDIKQSKTIVI